MHHEYMSYPGYSHFSMVIDRADIPVRVYEKGTSIAQKRDEIVSQLAHIRNAQQARGASTYSVDSLSVAFEKSFGKATSGYWRGGLRDPFWRCLFVPDSPGFLCSMVADQLDEVCEERLTPSAKRFLKILTCLSEALALHREMSRGHESLLAPPEGLGKRVLDDVNADWGMLDDRKRKHMVFRAETASFVEQMRCAVDEARSSVRPEKKHHGKREAINGGLYTIAAVVSGIALIMSTWVVAIIGFCIAMVIRCVSLGSIRGFDREKGWKAVESLLDQTKDFINREENAMHLSLNTGITMAQADQDRMVWQELQKTLHTVSEVSEQGKKTWDAVCELRQAVAAGAAETAAVKQDISAIKQELKQTSTSLREDIAQLRNMILFDTSSRKSATPEGRPASCGAEDVSPRAPMERATSLDTFRPSPISPQLRA